MAGTRSKRVALMVDGALEIHAEDISGLYATLCGVDGDDPELEQYPAEMPKGKRITCKQCYRIFKACKDLRAADFADAAKRNV